MVKGNVEIPLALVISTHVNLKAQCSGDLPY